MSNILGYYNNEKTKVSETKDENINMPVVFVRNANQRNQNLLIDSPDELFYNPSTKTLHADNFSGGIPSLIEGEAIELTTSNNSTEIDVNFTKNTEVVTSILDNDTFLVSNTSNNLKTITGANLKSDIRLSAGDNLEYGTGINSNKLSLKTALTNTSLNTGTSWNGNLIGSAKLSDGSVSDTEFQRLNGITSAILETSDKNTANGVCGLDANGLISNAQLPSSVNDIIEVANFAALPSTGESSKIYVTLNNHKAYRWSGSDYVEISASLVLGSTTGTAYDGGLGTANANAIATKQAILVDSSTSGILIDGNNNIDLDLTRTTAETTFDDNELMLIQKTNGNLCRLTKQQLKSSINTNTTYNNGSNITIDGSNDINLDTTLEDVNSIESSTNTDLEIKTTTDNEIQFKTNNTERLSIDSSKLDSSVDINIPLDKHYQINGVDVLHNTGSTTNIILNAKFIQNSVSPYDGLYINYLPGTTTTSHCRLYAGSTTSRMIIKADTGKIGIGTESPSEFLDVVGNINISTGKTYKINGTDLSGSNLNYSGTNTINDEIDTKQDILTFGKNSGNALKLNETVATFDFLFMGSDNVIGLTKAETQGHLDINNVENIAVSTLGGTNLTYNNNKLNLDTTLEDVNSIESSTNTDLNLQSNGTGDILLRAIDSSLSSVGKIKLMRTDTARFQTIEYKNDSSTNSYIKFLVHNGSPPADQVEVLRLKGNGDSDFSGNISIASGKTYKMDGTDLSGANLNYSAGVTINTELDSKQDILTFGKSGGNALKLAETVVTNEVLLVGSDNVIGVSYSELNG